MIYKFFGNIDFLLSTLSDSKLWFSKVDDFNDPFEWDVPYRIDISKNKEQIVNHIKLNNRNRPKEYIKAKIDFYLSNPLKLEEEFNKTLEYRKNKGVCCFAKEENLNNILMWSHYADNHKGITLGIDENLIEISHTHDWFEGKHITKPWIKQVQYTNEYRFINPFANERPSLKDVEFIKSTDWEYEKEVRLISPKFGLHDFNSSHCLKEIVFGLKIPEIVKSNIINLFKKDILNDIKIMNCSKEKDKIELKVE
ncbi:MAG: DUF2971 domain-containing protein [Chlorobi bacterium]|nr:DUF2971 domain-containing protein [Chlorobiota bacterium]